MSESSTINATAEQPYYKEVPSLNESNNDTLNQSNTTSSAPSAALFEFSDFSFPYYYGTPTMNNTNATAINSVNFVPSGWVNHDNNTNINVNDIYQNDPSAFFRHRPDNPFWGIPSSMEADDWQAYLLPHQQEQQQRQQQQEQ